MVRSAQNPNIYNTFTHVINAARLPIMVLVGIMEERDKALNTFLIQILKEYILRSKY